MNNQPGVRQDQRGEVLFRLATVEDSSTLGPLNAQLIRDEGHRNSMTVPQFVERMADWLRGEYEAVVAEQCGAIVGYALFRQETDYLYLRQIFVRSENRRRHVGYGLVDWLVTNACQAVPRIRIDVLVENEAGQRFWESIGFREYCLTMELELPPRAVGDQSRFVSPP